MSVTDMGKFGLLYNCYMYAVTQVTFVDFQDWIRKLYKGQGHDVFHIFQRSKCYRRP
jgi:hypothetical protein